MRKLCRLPLIPLLGFLISALFAVLERWSVPEFGWSTWLSGLIFCYACIVSWAIHLLLTAPLEKAALEERLPFLAKLNKPTFTFLLVAFVLFAGFLAFRIYSFVFSFYGLFLSVFAEMQPETLFGRNGFINSDFYTPVFYLLRKFWPMALGTLIANLPIFLNPNKWHHVLLPFRFEILRMHLLTLALPFFSLLSWIIFKQNYQTITILLLLAVFYLLPQRHSA